jgi:3-oxoacyl-[acyl-carrier-protein] synthase II
MEVKRVVITGMGAVAPNGIGIDNFWDSLVHGQSGIKKITRFDASSYPCQVAAEVQDFDPLEYMAPKTARRLDRFAQFALAASRMGIEDSRIDLGSIDPCKAGVIIGTAIGGGECKENQHTIFMEKGIKRLSPFAALMICNHSATAIISCELGLKGLNTTLASACNSGLDVIYLAYNAIRLGDADMIVTGAGEAPITPYIVGLFCAAGILSRDNGDPLKVVKPFDMNGNGTVLGEGGAVLILEELESALKRRAKIYGEIMGYASGQEAYDLFDIAPSGETVSMVMRNAIKKSNLKASDIEYINAHGNGLLRHDLNESRGIKEVFGASACHIPVTSIKPITGQSFSVTGILQMITCLLAITRSVIPPTINHFFPNSDCDLDYVPNHFRESVVNTALMNARGFGGSHTAIVVRKFR